MVRRRGDERSFFAVSDKVKLGKKGLAEEQMEGNGRKKRKWKRGAVQKEIGEVGEEVKKKF
jgi:hypothetical protein